jgi:tetratricopeptide (TPR) repeat protein
MACYRKAIALDAKLVMPHYNLGNALLARGKADEASAELRQATLLDPQYAEAHCNLGFALRQQGRLAESLESFRRGHALGVKQNNWPYPSALWVRQAERLAAALEQKLPAFLNGEYRPTANKERLGLASVCLMKKLYRAAASLYAAILATDPRLAEDMKEAHRYRAACAAALAGSNQGSDAGNAQEQARWRRQALTWLRADLAHSARQLQSGQAAGRFEVQARMRLWLRDSALAGLRDRDAVAKLPAEERQACHLLWADVAALLKKADRSIATWSKP